MDDVDRHLFQPLLDRAARAPEDVFATLIAGGTVTTLTLGALLDEAAAFRAGLSALGLPEGGLVVIILPSGRSLYSAFLACTLAGLVPSFLPPMTFKQDPAHFTRAMAALFARIRPAAVITDAQAGAQVPAQSCPILTVDALPAPPRSAMPALPPGGGRVALLQHTSGTTALKKGVMLSHAQVLAQAAAYAAAIGLQPGETIASWLPLYHDMGLLTAFLIPAIIGCPIVALDAQEWAIRPTMLLDAIQTYRARHVWLPNFAFPHLARAAGPDLRWDLSSLRTITNCSEVCRAAAFTAFLDRFEPCGIGAAALATCYAMAESVFALTQSPLGRPARRGSRPETAHTVSSGRALPGVALAIHRPDGVAAATGDLGEIWVQAPFLFSGYFRLPEATAAKFHDGWYRTGDLGCLDDGELFVLGRIDDLLNISGRNLFAHEVEDEVGRLPGIAPGRVLAFAAHDAASGSNRLTVLAEPADATTDARAAAAAIRQAVFSATGIAPAVVRLLPRGFLLKSTSGKLARQDSIAKFHAAGAAGGAAV